MRIILKGLVHSYGVMMDYSLLLIAGAISALLMVNFGDAHLYHEIIHHELYVNDWLGHLHDGHRIITPHWIVNDVLMALFFAIAGVEVWEAIVLKHGALHNPRKAATPIVATIGGVLGPIGIYLGVAAASGRFADLSNGWAIPTATDIAFSYLIARIIFGRYHPAIKTLLTIALIDDLIGLLIIAFAFPQAPIELMWMGLPGVAMLIGYIMRGYGVKDWRAYMPLGMISWFGFAEAGLHPALGLIPMILVMPHAHADLGLFTSRELDQHDALSEFEHVMKLPVEVILLLFGFMNAGVELSAINIATIAVLSGLILGKTIGITLFAYIAIKSGLRMPSGVNMRDVFILSMIASIGFTVALFMSEVAFPLGAIQDGAKMGALLSLAVALIAIPMGKILRVERVTEPLPETDDIDDEMVECPDEWAADISDLPSTTFSAEDESNHGPGDLYPSLPSTSFSQS